MTTVKVLRRGIFNNPRHKAIGWCEEGDVIEVADGWYTDSLIADGFVQRVTAPELTETVEPVPEDLEDTNVDSGVVSVDATLPDLGTSPAGKEWEDHTILELRDYARDMGVVNYTTLRKADLVNALLAKQLEAQPGEL